MNRTLWTRLDKLAQKVATATEPRLSSVVGESEKDGSLIVCVNGETLELPADTTDEHLDRLFRGRSYLRVNFDPRITVSPPGEASGDAVS
jgi:hypothetical protein